MPRAKLPLTHFDRIRKLRPELWGYLDRDIARLRQMGWQGPVASVDDYDSREFEPCVTFLFEKFVRDTAAEIGFPVANVMAHFRQTSDAQLLNAGSFGSSPTTKAQRWPRWLIAPMW